MSFEEQFPSLKNNINCLMMPDSNGNVDVDVLASSEDILISRIVLANNCLDKQKVRELIQKIQENQYPYDYWFDILKKELRL